MCYSVTIETKEGEPVCIFPRGRFQKKPSRLVYEESGVIKQAARDLASAHKKDMLVVVEKGLTTRREPVILFETLGDKVLTEVDPRKELENLGLARFSESEDQYPKSLEDFLEEL